MTSEEKDQLLDRYVTGQPMSDEEEALIDQLLDQDPDFRKEYKMRLELFEFGKRERREEWKNREKPDNVRPLPIEKPSFPFQWAAAAAVVLLLGAGLIWWLRMPTDQFIGTLPVYEQHDTQVGFIKPGQTPVAKATWVVTKSATSEYRFSNTDTLQIFTPEPERWKNQSWQIVRLSEVRYRLQVGNDSYMLEQGRDIRIPLERERK